MSEVIDFPAREWLQDCTIRNDGDTDARYPIGDREAYLILAPGQEATIRSIGFDRCQKTAGESAPGV